LRSDKYERRIELLCPTCGGTQFKFVGDADASDADVVCVSCNRKMTKEELIRENQENISEHQVEIVKEVLEDVAYEMRSALKRAFRGNKNIKIK